MGTHGDRSELCELDDFSASPMGNSHLISNTKHAVRSQVCGCSHPRIWIPLNPILVYVFQCSVTPSRVPQGKSGASGAMRQCASDMAVPLLERTRGSGVPGVRQSAAVLHSTCPPPRGQLVQPYSDRLITIWSFLWRHNGRDGVSMGAMASQITSPKIVYSTVYSDTYQRRHQLRVTGLRGNHRWPVNYPHKWPVSRKMFPFVDVIMCMQIRWL